MIASDYIKTEIVFICSSILKWIVVHQNKICWKLKHKFSPPFFRLPLVHSHYAFYMKNAQKFRKHDVLVCCCISVASLHFVMYQETLSFPCMKCITLKRLLRAWHWEASLWLSLQIAVPIHFVCSAQMFAVCTQTLLMTMFFWFLQKVMNPSNSVDLNWKLPHPNYHFCLARDLHSYLVLL